MKSMIRIACVAAAALASLHSGVQAQEYPSRPIQMIVPYSPASGVDILARVFAQALQSQMNVPIVVENRDGATGQIGSAFAAKAAADGYTIMVNANPPFTLATLYTPNPQYDPVTSFTPITRVGAVPMLLVTSAQSPIKTFQELKDYAAANPDRANYGTNGNGSPAQVNMEIIKQGTGLKIVEVPYKSTGQMTTDATGGHLTVTLLSLALADQLIQGGKLRVLAVGTKERLKRFPDAPTFGELVGQRDHQGVVWYGFFGPAGLPADRVRRLHAEFSKALSNPKVVETMNTAHMIPELLAPGEFAASLKKDAEMSRTIVKSLEKK